MGESGERLVRCARAFSPVHTAQKTTTQLITNDRAGEPTRRMSNICSESAAKPKIM